jgi:exodeoxyribonuclease-3
VTNPEKKKRHVCFHTDVKKAFQKVAMIGFVDLFRKYYPDETGRYTFFDYRVRDAVGRNIGWRIDHIMASNSLADKSRACYVDMKPRLAPKPSDHTILVGEIGLSD